MSPADQTKGPSQRRKFARQTSIDPALQTARNDLVPSLLAKEKVNFDPHAFLSTIGEGRKSLLFQRKQGIFAQGDTADAVFYIQTGKVELTVVSNIGKEATIGILG
jgi:CRP-like cAMP-binding protein